MSDNDENPDVVGELEEAEWSWIEPHLKRDSVIVVRHGLSLSDAGQAISADHKARVQAWVAEGTLSRPSEEQIQAWGATPGRKFRILIVQPFVLIQEVLLN